MPASYTALGDLPFRAKLTYLPIALVREGPKLAILLNQAALFGLYGKGLVFQPANGRRPRDTGAWLVVDGIAPLLCHIGLAVTGLEVDRRWANLGSVQEVVVGLPALRHRRGYDARARDRGRQPGLARCQSSCA